MGVSTNNEKLIVTAFAILTFAPQMYDYAQIRSVHLELTERCNAACPQCPRRIDGGRINPNLTGAELTLADIRRMLPVGFIRQLKKIYLCGNYGDPAAAQETLEITRYFRETSPLLTLGVHSNGSLRPTAWWTELAGIIGTHGYVRFAIDGLEDTNAIYRRNTEWAKIIANAEAYIAAGGRAEWDFIVFAHNEHQVEAARQLSQQLGFKAFNVKKTARFLQREIMAVAATPVRSGSGALVGAIKSPERAEYQNEFLGSLGEKEATYGNFENYLAQTEIRCKVMEDKSVYISAEGFALPCCWLAAMLRNPSGSETRQFAEVFPAIENHLDTGRENLQKIVEGDFFRHDIPMRQEKGHRERLKVCARVCGHG